MDPSVPSTLLLLDFFQTGLNLGLGLSTLKLQMAAISAATHKRSAEDLLVVQFFRAVKKIHPPTRQSFPKWDLPLILEVFAEQHFALSEASSLWNLTLKLAFLIAITSSRRVSDLQALKAEEDHILFYPDRVELCTICGFVPKVSTPASLGEPWALPVFSETTSSSLHELDVAFVLRCYLSLTSPFRKSINLFVLPGGKNKGKQASARTIASWIVKLIHQAYRSKV